MRDFVEEQHAHDFVGGEVRSVIGFEHQRRPKRGEEINQRDDRRLGIGMSGGQDEQLVTGGQIPHRQEVRIDAVDGDFRFGEVCGPDASGLSPGQMFHGTIMFRLIRSEDRVQGGTGDIGKGIF